MSPCLAFCLGFVAGAIIGMFVYALAAINAGRIRS